MIIQITNPDSNKLFFVKEAQITVMDGIIIINNFGGDVHSEEVLYVTTMSGAEDKDSLTTELVIKRDSIAKFKNSNISVKEDYE